MTKIFHIEINSGVITYDSAKVTRSNIDANKYHAVNAKQYFLSKGKAKPAPVIVRGWPFSKMFLISGDEENGQAVAWA